MAEAITADLAPSTALRAADVYSGFTPEQKRVFVECMVELLDILGVEVGDARPGGEPGVPPAGPRSAGAGGVGGAGRRGDHGSIGVLS